MEAGQPPDDRVLPYMVHRCAEQEALDAGSLADFAQQLFHVAIG